MRKLLSSPGRAQRAGLHLSLVPLAVTWCLACSGQDTSAGLQKENEEEWTSFRGNPLNEASRTFDISSARQPTDWTFKPSSWTWAYRPGTGVWSSPSVGKVGERIVLFVGSYDKNLYAIDAFTGA